MNDRAITYRKLNDIPEAWGTAVNVQAMVFGNLGETSATGVAFTRDPSNGEAIFYGEYLINAQGEDVVAGIRTPAPISRERAAKLGSADKPLEDVDAGSLCASCAMSPTRSSTITRTCRTSNSPSKTAASTCCRPATANARPAPR